MNKADRYIAETSLVRKLLDTNHACANLTSTGQGNLERSVKLLSDDELIEMLDRIDGDMPITKKSIWDKMLDGNFMLLYLGTIIGMIIGIFISLSGG